MGFAITSVGFWFMISFFFSISKSSLALSASSPIYGKGFSLFGPGKNLFPFQSKFLLVFFSGKTVREPWGGYQPHWKGIWDRQYSIT
ncbi:hypothetical protein X474_18465 [Dethiosulfatarculus sandiegensis]|uniref:Uncharacterized protein n=1 Tax=Dethiosulfatarculus sandiegensis TaxID=1429043 RepID=A0A0D2J334_9BACT|nr:hypothetical protein X474_18465 [Dethiosulfatarculus sandiegensis]